MSVAVVDEVVPAPRPVPLRPAVPADEATTSVFFPTQPDGVDALVPFAELLLRRGSGRLWLGQSLGLETHLVFAHLAGAGLRVPFGTGVSLTPLRHPYDAALHAKSVAAMSGAPFVAGVGPGAAEFQAALRGLPYPRPVTTTREYVATMRALLAGETVGGEGGPGTPRFALPVLPDAEVQLGMGVLRPAMARAAGAVADVAVTWLTPADWLRDTLVPALDVGAREAGRVRPRIATVVHVALARRRRDLRAVARAATHRHLSAPHYVDMLRRSGLDVEVDDPAAGADELLRSAVYVTGDAEEVAAQLGLLREAGVGEVVLNPAGVLITEGVGAALADVRAVLAACGDPS